MTHITFSRGMSTPMVIGIIVLLLIIGWLGYSVTQAPESADDLVSEEEETMGAPKLPEDDEEKLEKGGMMEEDGAMMEKEDMMEEDGMMIEEKKGEGMMMKEESVVQIKVFDLTGQSFSFSQSELRVKKGDRVRINFTSTDGFHDWSVDEFNAATSRVNTGGSASVEFTADKAGTFEYYCSVGNHRQLGMKGNLIVE